MPPLEELRLEQRRRALAIVPRLHVSPVVGVLEGAVGRGHGALGDLDQQVPKGGPDVFQVLLIHRLREASCGRRDQRHQVQRWAPLVGELVKCRNICYNMG